MVLRLAAWSGAPAIASRFASGVTSVRLGRALPEACGARTCRCVPVPQMRLRWIGVARRSGEKLYNALSRLAAIVIKTMKKPSIYIDTSIISAFWHESPDVSMLARRFHTREWWNLERRHFTLWAS